MLPLFDRELMQAFGQSEMIKFETGVRCERLLHLDTGGLHQPVVFDKFAPAQRIEFFR